MKKKLSLLLVLLISITALVGCKKAPTARELLEQAEKNHRNAKSYECEMLMDMVLTMKASGIAMNMEMGMDVEYVADLEEEVLEMTGNVRMKAMGEEIDQDIHTITAIKNDEVVLYVENDGKWSSAKLDSETESSDAIDKIFALCKDVENMKLLEETKEVNGKECYVIEVIMGPEMVLELLEQSSSSSIEELEAFLKDVKIEDMDLESILEIGIDKKSGDYVYCKADIADYLEKMMTEAMKEAMKGQIDTTDFSIKIDAMEMEQVVKSYNTDVNIEIPDAE